MGYNKYIYENDFDQPKHEAIEDHQISEADLLAIKESAFQEGLEEGRQKEKQEIDRQLLHALMGFQDHLVRFIDVEAEKRQLVQGEAARLAKTVAMKICVSQAELHAIDRVAACMDSVTKTLLGKPKVTINVNPKIVSPLSERVHQMIENGLVQIVTDESLEPMDCRFSWAEGGAESILEKTLGDVENIITKTLQIKENRE